MSPYILLGFFIAGLLHVFVKPATMSRHLSGPGFKPVIKAALFGIPLPLCSCGVLPTAVSLRRQGASNAATTSFLIATPQTGADSIAATYSLLGLPFAVLRPAAALVGAVAGGFAVDRYAPEARIEEASSASSCGCGDGCCSGHELEDERPQGFWRKLVGAVRYGFVDMVASVGKWLVIGLVVAALITVFVPDSLFTGLSEYPILAMLAVVVVAIPMYICATGSIPIALSLMLKGLSPGAAFVMLMAGPAANFASILILRRTQGVRATAVYVGSVVLTAIAFGLMIDHFMPASWFVPKGFAEGAANCHLSLSAFDAACSVLLVALLVYAGIKNRSHRNNHNLSTISDMKQTYKISGMNCAHCRASVEKAISGVAGVENVEVSLSEGRAVVDGTADASAIKAAVELAGFECEPA